MDSLSEILNTSVEYSTCRCEILTVMVAILWIVFQMSPSVLGPTADILFFRRKEKDAKETFFFLSPVDRAFLDIGCSDFIIPFVTAAGLPLHRTGGLPAGGN